MRIFLLELPGGTPPPTAGDAVLLPVSESHHILNVLRAGENDELTLTDGQGHFYSGSLAGKHGRRVRVMIHAVRDDPADTRRPHLVLACAVVKHRRFEWALEKSVELGVHEIWPLHTARTVIVPGNRKQERWRTILQTALKQAGRSFLPRLQPVTDLTTCLAALRMGWVAYGEAVSGAAGGSLGDFTGESTGGSVGDAAVPESCAGAWWRMTLPPVGAETGETGETLPPTLAWVVGPEGGWTEEERHRLAADGAVPVSLGPYRLRTETAALAGLAVMQSWRQAWLDRKR